MKTQKIMPDKHDEGADSTALRVALWRALHMELDQPPHILEDEIGLQLAAPDAGWRNRPDMDPNGTKCFRASILARARFIEDLVLDQVALGADQYVILGAGLDSFAFRRPASACRLRIFEIDRPGPQAWKRKRLAELGYDMGDLLRFVPANFEADGDWWKSLAQAGFEAARPAVVASVGVSMYLTKEATFAMLREVASLVPGSTLAMSFLLPLAFADPGMRPWLERAEKGARASGTPFISYFTPEEMLALARDAGFGNARHVSAESLAERYFRGRTDGLCPPNNTEELLVATTGK